MEITGLKCNNRDCAERIFLEDPDAVNWMTVVMTSPGTTFRAKVHYCPLCARKTMDTVDLSVEVLTTAQTKVINPAHVDDTLTRALARSHEDEDRLSGVPVSGWPAPAGEVPVGAGSGPTVAVPISPPVGTDAITQMQAAAAVGGGVVRLSKRTNGGRGRVAKRRPVIGQALSTVVGLIAVALSLVAFP